MRGLIVFCFMAVIYSCTDNNKIPSDVIPKDKMESLMWDMLQADRFNSLFVVPELDSSKIDSAVFSLYDRVFQLHHTNREEFLKSYKFYLGRPDLTKTMFDSISVHADKRRADVYKSRHKDSTGKKTKPVTPRKYE